MWGTPHVSQRISVRFGTGLMELQETSSRPKSRPPASDEIQVRELNLIAISLQRKQISHQMDE